MKYSALLYWKDRKLTLCVYRKCFKLSLILSPAFRNWFSVYCNYESMYTFSVQHIVLDTYSVAFSLSGTVTYNTIIPSVVALYVYTAKSDYHKFIYKLKIFTMCQVKFSYLLLTSVLFKQLCSEHWSAQQVK